MLFIFLTLTSPFLFSVLCSLSCYRITHECSMVNSLFIQRSTLHTHQNIVNNRIIDSIHWKSLSREEHRLEELENRVNIWTEDR
jgi:hypothetical protein